MVGTIVLYHPEADEPGQAAIVVGVLPRSEEGAEALNLLVFPDADGGSLEEIAESLSEDAGGPVIVDAWMPYRAMAVTRDQVGKAEGPFWSPVDPGA